MLGLREGDETATRTEQVPPGATLVFYTDGLVEVTRDMDAGFRRLSETLAKGDVLRTARPADEIVRAVLGSDLAQDDIAVLVITFEDGVA
jgi:serine phosphatase RsbU (regulator of sigma subunit)